MLTTYEKKIDIFDMYYKLFVEKCVLLYYFIKVAFFLSEENR